MRSTAVSGASFPAWPTRWTLRPAPRKRRGLPMQRASGVVEFVFEPFDLLAERVPFLAIPIPVLISRLMLAAPALDLPLLPFKLSDQLLARRGAPLRSQHTLLMPCLAEEYKRKVRRSRRSDDGSQLTTR